jgi:cysteine desulfurase
MEADPAYLDNASTTRVLPEVLAEMAVYFTAKYGNPSSSHIMGVEAARAADASSAELARCVGGGEWDVVFTASGTEANNLAIAGYAPGPRGRSIVTTSIEHASVLEPCKLMAEKGLELVRAAPGPDGVVSSDELMRHVTGSTVLVTIQHANNEIGTLQPVEENGRALKKLHPQALLHIDAVQTAGKMDLSAASVWADLVTLSAHKIHGPKGIGALTIRKGIRKPSPIIRGGGQQGGLRSGTENVPGMAGLATALRLAAQAAMQSAAHLKRLEEAFDSAFRETPSACRLFRNSPHVPGFIVVGFRRVPSEVVEHAMEAEGIIVSSAAACSSRKARRSHVLEAAGVGEDSNVIRIVPSRFTRPDEMERAALALNRILDRLA